jgi:hypothetical protein
MNSRLSLRPYLLALFVVTWLVTAPHADAQTTAPLGGFIPYVGMTLTDQYETASSSVTFFISERQENPGGSFLGGNPAGVFDIALLDTGAATHIITSSASSLFNIDGEGFDGENSQLVGGATGFITLDITDPLGVYAAGMGDRTSAGANLRMDTFGMHGQTSFAILDAPPEWTLPNIIGLPMAAQHKITIRNDQPQIFELNGRTVRTPQVEFGTLGTGGDGIQRRTQMNLNPGISFVQGPIYIQNLDLFTLEFHENPLSPTVIENGGLYVDVDLGHDGFDLQDTEFLFDTGADLTVVSQQTAVRLGFDPVLDTPDFVLQVEGSGGVIEGVPGFYLDQLRLDTVGGSFEIANVPVAVLDVTNPNDPGNVVPGILGTQVFNGRNLVIDANPSIGGGGFSSSLYISDPVTQSHHWNSQAATADWVSSGSWSAAGVPAQLWDTVVANVRGSDQEAVLATNSTVFRATISGAPGAEMAVRITSGGALTLFADLTIQDHGRLHLDGGSMDAALIQLDGGSLTGDGTIFVGNGPLSGAVRNVSGRVAPGDPNGDPVGLIEITGDLVNDANGTLAFDLGGTMDSQYDRIDVDRFAFLSGELEVSLAGFDPSIGNSFTIITTGGEVSGQFSSLSLPSAFTWDVNYNLHSVDIEVTGMGFNGDFNGDGALDCDDIDQLVAAVASGSTSSMWDANGDGSVNLDDVNEWVLNLKGTLLGDANLDGQVDGLDFVAWNTNKFTPHSTWCGGDFDASGAVDGLDFVIWNTNKFQSASPVTVPEPAGMILLLVSWGMAVRTLGCRRSIAPRSA